MDCDNVSSVLKPDYVDQGSCMEWHPSLFLKFFHQSVLQVHMFSEAHCIIPISLLVHVENIFSIFAPEPFMECKLYALSSVFLDAFSVYDSHMQARIQSKLQE